MLREIVFAKGKLNATKYQRILRSELLLFMTEMEDEKRISRQDDAPIRTTTTTKKWFPDFGIELLLASRPDLNLILLDPRTREKF